MTDPTMRRADELLTELVELVETARAVPMSSSCVVPREHTLDLLDDLREVLPQQLEDARRIVQERDAVLAEARSAAEEQRTRAAEEAEATRVAASEHADGLVARAQAEAARLVDEGKAENARLISSAGVHQSAADAAAALRLEADDYAAATRASAQAEAARAVEEATAYAAKLRADGDQWAHQTLSDIVDTLHHAAAVAERGRAQIASRQDAEQPPADGPGELFDGQSGGQSRG